MDQETDNCHNWDAFYVKRRMVLLFVVGWVPIGASIYVVLLKLFEKRTADSVMYAVFFMWSFGAFLSIKAIREHRCPRCGKPIIRSVGVLLTPRCNCCGLGTEGSRVQSTRWIPKDCDAHTKSCAYCGRANEISLSRCTGCGNDL
jgi:hypothetical protein